MNCGDCRLELEGLAKPEFEGLSPAARLHLQQCPDCRRRFEALRLLARPRSLRREAPAGLEESIAARYASAVPGVGSGGKVVPLPAGRRRVTATVWRIGAAAAAVLVAALSISLVLLHGANGSPNEVAVTLTLKDPSARSVSVVGDWNGWSPTAQPMRRSDGLWEVKLELKRGHDYQYQFLVNKESWIPDPHSPLKVPNGFGGINSVLAT